MERFSVIFISLCSLATILAESMPTGSSTTIETLWDNAHEVGNVENHPADLLKQKNVQNNTKHLLLDENLVKNTTQVGEHAKNPLYFNKASTTLTGDFSSSYIKDTQHLKHNGDREGDDKEEPSVGLSSYDILLDPSLIPARLTRQARKGDADYSNLASSENVSGDVEPNNYDENRSVISSKRSANLESDLDVAEDRYQPPYPYRYPYYRGQLPNQRYRANDRREPYRNYWRYPVFPGK
ncbi:uncharacterized protein [Temnothorax nylanderi]|uniref:uncharacterized protein n=1 Tax=Temnothorax nylanderi TaxID=102681 RepID=UPI003A881A94